jgi:hypothetical protein
MHLLRAVTFSVAPYRHTFVNNSVKFNEELRNKLDGYSKSWLLFVLFQDS